MKKFAVFIATTGGPIQIERLTPERAPQSMICISRSSNILPISGEYDDFVRRGSGIIEREFGPFEYESFRADISGSVGTGQSWQLPFFIAHAIDAAAGSELVEDVDAADYVVWATGRVDYDLNILDVDHIAEKIKGSHSLFEKIASSQSKAVIAAPASQISLLDEIPSFGEFFSVLPAESGFQVCKDLDLNLEPKTASGSIKNRSGEKSRFAAVVLAAAIVIAWSFFYFAPVKKDILVSWRERVLTAVGFEKILNHEARLLEYGTAALSDIPGLQLIGTARNKASILSFVLEGAHPHDIGTIVDMEGVSIRTGHHCTQPLMDRFGIPATARASIAMYNTRQEIDQLVRALHRVREMFSS